MAIKTEVIPYIFYRDVPAAIDKAHDPDLLVPL